MSNIQTNTIKFRIQYKVQYGIALYLVLHCKQYLSWPIRMSCIQMDNQHVWETQPGIQFSSLQLIDSIIYYQYFTAQYHDFKSGVKRICWEGTTQVMIKSFKRSIYKDKFVILQDHLNQLKGLIATNNNSESQESIDQQQVVSNDIVEKSMKKVIKIKLCFVKKVDEGQLIYEISLPDKLVNTEYSTQDYLRAQKMEKVRTKDPSTFIWKMQWYYTIQQLQHLQGLVNIGFFVASTHRRLKKQWQKMLLSSEKKSIEQMTKIIDDSGIPYSIEVVDEIIGMSLALKQKDFQNIIKQKFIYETVEQNYQQIFQIFVISKTFGRHKMKQIKNKPKFWQIQLLGCRENINWMIYYFQIYLLGNKNNYVQITNNFAFQLNYNSTYNHNSYCFEEKGSICYTYSIPKYSPQTNYNDSDYHYSSLTQKYQSQFPTYYCALSHKKNIEQIDQQSHYYIQPHQNNQYWPKDSNFFANYFKKYHFITKHAIIFPSYDKLQNIPGQNYFFNQHPISYFSWSQPVYLYKIIVKNPQIFIFNNISNYRTNINDLMNFKKQQIKHVRVKQYLNPLNLKLLKKAQIEKLFNGITFQKQRQLEAFLQKNGKLEKLKHLLRQVNEKVFSEYKKMLFQLNLMILSKKWGKTDSRSQTQQAIYRLIKKYNPSQQMTKTNILQLLYQINYETITIKKYNENIWQSSCKKCDKQYQLQKLLYQNFQNQYLNNIQLEHQCQFQCKNIFLGIQSCINCQFSIIQQYALFNHIYIQYDYISECYMRTLINYAVIYSLGRNIFGENNFKQFIDICQKKFVPFCCEHPPFQTAFKLSQLQKIKDIYTGQMENKTKQQQIKKKKKFMKNIQKQILENHEQENYQQLIQFINIEVDLQKLKQQFDNNGKNSKQIKAMIDLQCWQQDFLNKLDQIDSLIGEPQKRMEKISSLKSHEFIKVILNFT